MIDELVAALRSEFAGDVTFMAQVPKQVTPPSIVVSPGDVYLEPREIAGPLIREHWVVLVAVSTKNMAGGLNTMRENSLRVRRAASSVGAVWTGASGPRRLADQATGDTETVVSLNDVHFRYDATTITS